MRRRLALLTTAAWLAGTVAVTAPAAAAVSPAGPPDQAVDERSVFNCEANPGQHYAVGVPPEDQRRNVGGRCLTGERNVGG